MRRLLLVLLLLPTLASAAALSRLRVVDSAGRTVGYFNGAGSAVRRELGTVLIFGVSTKQIYPISQFVPPFRIK
jgi:hypothetical protein